MEPETTPEPIVETKVTETKTVEAKAGEAKPSPLGEQKLTITVAEWQATQAKLNEFGQYKQAEAERAEKREQDKLKLMGEKEGVEKALQAQREQSKVREKESADKFAALHQTIASEKVDATIASAIAGRTFIGQTDDVRAEAARDFQDIVRASGRFSATQDAAGKWSVRETATGRDATEVLGEIIKAKSYLFKATTDGGVNIDGSHSGGNDSAKSQAVREFEQWQSQNQTNNQIGLFPMSSRN